MRRTRITFEVLERLDPLSNTQAEIIRTRGMLPRRRAAA
jgi:hypothetical protein